MIKVVSFDIGGTLIKKQDKSYFTPELKRILEKYGKKSAWEFECLRVNDFSIEDYCKYIGVDCAEEIRNLIKRTERRTELYKEVREVLLELKKRYKLVTISNAVSIKSPKLSNCQIGEFFDLELYSYQFGELKPNIKMFKYVEQYCDVSGAECIHIGDTKNDIEGASRVGWKKVLLCREDGPAVLGEGEQPDYIIHNLLELFPILREL